MKNQFKYIVNVTKAVEEGGKKYLIGEASGPEVDVTDERMHPTAIELFRNQVQGMSAQGEPLVLRDAHAADGVLRDLGWIVDADIDEAFHLVIKAELDPDNPAAMSLWKQLQKGKQYGLSIGGRVLDYVDEFVQELGKSVRTYLNILLNEISVTTRPAWQPSFGTVLSKSIDEAMAASATKEGANPVEDEELQPGQDVAPDAAVKSDEPETPAVDDAQKADESVELPDGVIETLEDGTPVERSNDDTDDEDVEKAGRRISTATGKRLLAQFQSMKEMLVELGLLDNDTAPEKSVSGDEESPLVKSLRDEVAAEKDVTKALQASLAEANRRIEELEKTPAAAQPQLAMPREEADETLKALFKLPARERLAIALQLDQS